jgi:hypothetical protein
MTEVWFAYHPATGCWWTTNQHAASCLRNEGAWQVRPGQASFNTDSWHCVLQVAKWTVTGQMLAASNAHTMAWVPFDDSLAVMDEPVRSGVTLEELFAEDEE